MWDFEMMLLWCCTKFGTSTSTYQHFTNSFLQGKYGVERTVLVCPTYRTVRSSRTGLSYFRSEPLSQYSNALPFRIASRSIFGGYWKYGWMTIGDHSKRAQFRLLRESQCDWLCFWSPYRRWKGGRAIFLSTPATLPSCTVETKG